MRYAPGSRPHARQPQLLAGASLVTLALASWVSAAHAEAAGAEPSGSDTDAAEAEAEAGSDAAPEQPDTAACLAAHVKAQALKKETRFNEAQEQLLICSTASCPGPVIEDCGEWIGELDRRTPSLAFSVTLDGVESQEARVTLNGALITDREGITKVDPGRHVVRAELAPFPAREQVVFARDGGGTQVVDFEFETTKAAPGASAMDAGPPEPTSRPTPTIVYPLLGLSAAGFAGFGVFGLIGNQRKGELETECEPSCTDEQLQPMKNAYLIGDISLAVGAASLLTATIVYLARPAEAAPGQDVAFQLHPVVGLEKRGSFGVVAVQAW